MIGRQVGRVRQVILIFYANQIYASISILRSRYLPTYYRLLSDKPPSNNFSISISVEHQSHCSQETSHGSSSQQVVHIFKSFLYPTIVYYRKRFIVLHESNSSIFARSNRKRHPHEGHRYWSILLVTTNDTLQSISHVVVKRYRKNIDVSFLFR